MLQHINLNRQNILTMNSPSSTRSKVTELHSYKESSVSKLIDTEISAENLMKNKDVVSV